MSVPVLCCYCHCLMDNDGMKIRALAAAEYDQFMAPGDASHGVCNPCLTAQREETKRFATKGGL